MLIDPSGRRLDYLRLSVTDRCNLRCVYCLPSTGAAFKPWEDVLTDEEIARLTRLLAGHGVSKVRVTGGEPLTRPGIAGLIRRIVGIEGIDDLSLSTNGVLFSKMAQELWENGLRRVNISLDSLNAEKFKRITRFGSVDEALAGIEAALTLGFDPVKINVVVMRGMNDEEIPAFVRLTQSLPVHVRFIELMPVGDTGFFSKDSWLPLDEIRSRCGELKPLEARSWPRGWGPAFYCKAPGALGSVGFISALSCNFCSRCNRMRLTSSGRLHPCLASGAGVDLKDSLRSGAGDEELSGLILQAVGVKPERHHMEEAAARESFMCALGG